MYIEKNVSNNLFSDTKNLNLDEIYGCITLEVSISHFCIWTPVVCNLI